MALKYIVEDIEQINEQLREHYREEDGKWFLDADGVKPTADFDRVQNALLAERKEKKDYKDKYSSWDTRFPGKTPEEIATQFERIPLLEAESQGKVDPKRLAEITETTVKQRMAPLEHENGKLKQSLAEQEQVINQFKQNERRRTLHDAVRGVAVKEGYQESAYANSEGALMLLAERNFTITDMGDVVVADESRILTPGLGLREALVEVKNLYPYLVKNSMGGGAAGSNGAAGGGTSANVFRSNDMTARGRFIKENEKDPSKVEFAWKQAGLSSPWAPYTAK
jgi:hypothetical protein